MSIRRCFKGWCGEDWNGAEHTRRRVWVNGPTLLVGLVRCGICGSPMTTATGKSGRYPYYKCTSKINNVGKKECQNANVRMETLDRLVLQAVAEKVFTPERVPIMMTKVKFDLKESQPNYDEQIRRLSREMEDIKKQTDNLFDAVEKGFLPLNESLHERVHRHEARRQEILIELARLRDQKDRPISKLTKKHVAAFCAALKEKLQDKESRFGKEYLRVLLDEIRLVKKEVHLKGSYAALAGALSMGANQGSGLGAQIRPSWLPSADSNHGPDG